MYNGYHLLSSFVGEKAYRLQEIPLRRKLDLAKQQNIVLRLSLAEH